MRFSEAIKIFAKYKALEKAAGTIKGYDLDLRQFCLYLRNPMIMQVTPDHIIEYLNGMKELEWSQNTIMIKCVSFTQFFKFWKLKGYPVLNPDLIPHVKREYTTPRVGDDDRLRILIRKCDDYPNDPYFVRMKAMILLTADTGARNGEVCSFPISIDTINHEIFGESKQFFHIIKSEKSRGRNPYRKVFWYEETNEALKKWIEIRKTLKNTKDNDALFIGVMKQGARMAGERMTVSAFALALRKLSRMCNIKNLNAHSLRHKFGNELAANGANNSTISDLMGHASLSSSFVYTHLNDTQAKNAHAKFTKKKT